MRPPERAVVVAASESWVWVPPGAETVATEDYLLVRYPDHYSDNTQVVRTTCHRPVAGVVREVRARARAWGREEVLWVAHLGAEPPSLAADLEAAGGRLVETADVLSRGLADGGPDLAPPEDLELRVVDSVDVLADLDAVDIAVFGGRQPPAELLPVRAERAREALARGEELRAVAYLDGSPVGTGGLAMAGTVVRLFGGGVLASARGRGVYRALLDARLRWGVEHGGELALVRGRVDTSARILQRAGFTGFGQERSYAFMT